MPFVVCSSLAVLRIVATGFDALLIASVLQADVSTLDKCCVRGESPVRAAGSASAVVGVGVRSSSASRPRPTCDGVTGDTLSASRGCLVPASWGRPTLWLRLTWWSTTSVVRYVYHLLVGSAARGWLTVLAPLLSLLRCASFDMVSAALLRCCLASGWCAAHLLRRR
ncbi:hypothetical protein PF002_g16207 [Phytophthora fragariae]|uniref:Secreted protein n=1 Tax=Phytophthora fragariae TaxID=53985 RepID=A0A6A3YHX3_9STRA|nr:hypothetical protein PF002_g16207 [Phytophthora fragariae]